MSTRLLVERVRQDAENKESAAVAKSKLLTSINALLAFIAESSDASVGGKPLFQAIVVVFNDKAHTPKDVVEALSLIERLSKSNELCKILLNLTPLDEVFVEVKNRVRESEKLNTFMKSLKAVKDSDRAKKLIEAGESGDATSVATHTHTHKHNQGDPRTFTSMALEFVELYILAFKSMPAIESHDLPAFRSLFVDIIKTCKPLSNMVVANLSMFQSRLLELMKDVCANKGPDQAELAELCQFVDSMAICRTGLLTIADQIASLMKLVRCEEIRELRDLIHSNNKGKCLEGLANTAVELERFLVDGQFQPDGSRMARASSGIACRTLLEYGQCAGESDQVILAVCSSHC